MEEDVGRKRAELKEAGQVVWRDGCKSAACLVVLSWRARVPPSVFYTSLSETAALQMMIASRSDAMSTGRGGL